MPPPSLLRQRLTSTAPFLLAFISLLCLLALATDGTNFSEQSLQQPNPAQQSGAQVETSRVKLTPARFRVGLAGASRVDDQRVLTTTTGTEEGDLSFTIHPHFIQTPTFLARLRTAADRTVTLFGDVLLSLLGLDDDDFPGSPSSSSSSDVLPTSFEGSAGLTGWSESSLFVERTQAVYASRPSSFGPHLVDEALRGVLFPIAEVVSTDAYACTVPAEIGGEGERHKGGKEEGWVALVQRGQCPFSDKVRTAQRAGAKAVVFGDMEESEGGISGGKGLLTPWSPDDTDDINIPSIFVSRASYLSLVRAWQHVNDSEGMNSKLVGLEVVLSREEVFAWPLLDLLFLLLFLPSLLTLLTVFTQRVRTHRAAKAARADKDVVARLPVFRWGEVEKPVSAAAAAAAGTAGGEGEVDEEREVGTPRDEVDESTSLLHRTTSSANTPATPSLLSRAVSHLPRSLTRLLPSSLAPSPCLNSSKPRLLSRPTRRFPSLIECPFCLSDFEQGDLVMELPCGHLFHEEEVRGWLEGQKGVCPVCRESVLAPSSASLPTPAAAAAPSPLPSTDGAEIVVSPAHFLHHPALLDRALGNHNRHHSPLHTHHSHHRHPISDFAVQTNLPVASGSEREA